MSKLRTPRYYTGYREREDKMCASLKLLMLLNYSHGPGSRRYRGLASAHIRENTTHTFTVTSHIWRHILLCIMRGFACLFWLLLPVQWCSWGLVKSIHKSEYSHYTGLLPPLPGAANHLASPRAGDCLIVNSHNSSQMWGDGG